MNVQALLKQAQKMQSEIVKNEKELEQKIYVEENDFVKIEMDGAYHVNSIEIKKEDDKEMLQDMIAVTINKVIESAKEEHDQVMSKLTGGVKMPGMF